MSNFSQSKYCLNCGSRITADNERRNDVCIDCRLGIEEDYAAEFLEKIISEIAHDEALEFEDQDGYQDENGRYNERHERLDI
jgi:transcription initiation factor TFIIIB Brf1 subunit/transcription initiation factor TFIIB